MTTRELTEEHLKGLAEVSEFVQDVRDWRGKTDERMEELAILPEELKRLTEAVSKIMASRDQETRSRALREWSGGAKIHVPDGDYRGKTPLELAIMEAGLKNAAKNRDTNAGVELQKLGEARELLRQTVTVGDLEAFFSSVESTMRSRFTDRNQYDQVVSPMFNNIMNAAIRAAMDSTTAASGDELVPLLERAELWMDVNLETMIAPLIPTFPMPSSPFDIPSQLGDMNWFPGTENTATTETALTTAKATLTAYELVGEVQFSFTLDEDNVLPSLLGEIRSTIVRNAAEVLDDIILNADTTALNNINADGTTIAASDAGKGQWLVGYDGLRHLPLVDNTSQGLDFAAADPTDAMFNSIRLKLGKYGARPSQCAWIMDISSFILSQTITAFRTMDKLGPNATILTGMLGAVEGIPVIVSEQMALTDADGKITDAGNAASHGQVLCVNRTQWAQGYRRQLNIDVDRDTQKRQTIVTASFRHALTERTGTRSTATHTALAYEVGVDPITG